MTPLKISVSKREVAPRPRLARGVTAQPPLPVERRLAAVERELHIQFTRIAQLQAELDVLLATFRHATDTEGTILRAESVRLSGGLDDVRTAGRGLAAAQAVSSLGSCVSELARR